MTTAARTLSYPARPRSPICRSPGRRPTSRRSRTRAPACSCWRPSPTPTRWRQSPTSTPRSPIGGWGDGNADFLGRQSRRPADRHHAADGDNQSGRPDLRGPGHPYVRGREPAGHSLRSERHRDDRGRREHHAHQPSGRRSHGPGCPAHQHQRHRDHRNRGDHNGDRAAGHVYRCQPGLDRRRLYNRHWISGRQLGRRVSSTNSDRRQPDLCGLARWRHLDRQRGSHLR